MHARDSRNVFNAIMEQCCELSKEICNLKMGSDPSKTSIGRSVAFFLNSSQNPTDLLQPLLSNVNSSVLSAYQHF